MTEKKTTSDAAKRATQNYRAKNREKTKIQSAKSTAKTYINKYISTIAELEELEILISKKKEELKKQD